MLILSLSLSLHHLSVYMSVWVYVCLGVWRVPPLSLHEVCPSILAAHKDLIHSLSAWSDLFCLDVFHCDWHPVS
jgi:hypothetical protein